MNLLFIVGTQLIYNNENIFLKDLNPNLIYSIIFFDKDEVSKSYATQISKQLQIDFFNSINIFFQSKPDNVYSFNLGELSLHLRKEKTKISYSFDHAVNNLQSLEEYLSNSEILLNSILKIIYSQYNFGVYMQIIANNYFIILCLIVLIMFYNQRYYGVNDNTLFFNELI